MAAHAFLGVGEPQVWILQWRESYDPGIAALFLDEEAYRMPDASLHWHVRDPDSQTGFRTTAGNLRDRLTLLGYTSDLATTKVLSGWKSRVNVREVGPESPDELIAEWLSHLGHDDEDLPGFPHDSLMRIQDQWGYIWGQDRWIVRFFLDRIPDDLPVTLNLGAIWGLDGHVFTESLCANARAEEMSEATGSFPAIVLTEGTADAEFLSAAVEIARPHLVDFIRFLDYSGRAAGGADAVVKAIRAFGAARVGNRVLGLLDNDLAGREALDQINKEYLPGNMRAITLPEIEIARNYPAFGTEGLVSADLNGRAVSIEFFLGRRALSGDTGSLVPVQWTGYNEKFRSYQGGLKNKAGVQNAFRKIMKQARGGGHVDPLDWEDLGLLIDYIVASIP